MWLSTLIEAMDEVASSTAKPLAADRTALANRLNLPAMRPLLGILHPGNLRPADSACSSGNPLAICAQSRKSRAPPVRQKRREGPYHEADPIRRRT